MKLKVINDGFILKIMDCSEYEESLLRNCLTRYFNKNHKYINTGSWDGKIRAIDQSTNRHFSASLLYRVKDVFDKNNCDLQVENIELLFNDIEFNDFKKWVDIIFNGATNKGSKFYPYSYQITTAYKCIKNKFSLHQIATSGGKSLILYIVLRYMVEELNYKSNLVIVPSIDLVKQLFSDFKEYDSYLLDENVSFMTIKQIYGGESKDFNNDVIISTYQSLSTINNKDIFSIFESVSVDEVHTAQCKSIKDILSYCSSTKTRLGVTGTLPHDDFADLLNINMSLGCQMTNISAKYLEGIGNVTKSLIYRMNIYHSSLFNEYNSLNINDGSKLFQLEKDMVISSTTRKKLIIKNIMKLNSNNQLVLFHRVKYGKDVYNTLKEKGYNVFYIDGNISSKKRKNIIENMKSGTDKILIASFKILGTGISIKNLFYIHFIESFKDHKIIQQAIGRGLRKHKDKDIVYIFDYIDIFSKKKKNILQLHGYARQRIYKSKGFVYKNKDFTI